MSQLKSESATNKVKDRITQATHRAIIEHARVLDERPHYCG
jgi:hypothetical protein